MSTLSQNVITLLEQAKRNFNGEVQKIAEISERYNKVIETAAAYEANDTHSHVLTVRTEVPTFAARGPNEGASTGVSKVRQIREDIMVLDSITQIDELIYKRESNPREFIMTEAAGQMQGALQTFGTNVVYGNTATDPKVINGFATRYNSLALDNVEGASGTGSDLTRVIMVEWGRDAAYLIYPKGSSAGIMSKDLGENTVYDGSSNPYRAYEHQVQLQLGLAVADDRAVQQIVNMESAGTSNNFEEDAVTASLARRVSKLPKMGENAVIYVNRTLMGQLTVWALNKNNGSYSVETLANGTMLMRFQGIPVKLIEQIVDTESAVS